MVAQETLTLQRVRGNGRVEAEVSYRPSVLEANSMGLMKSRRIYQNRYIFVFRFREDRVVQWLEFFDPLAAAATMDTQS